MALGLAPSRAVSAHNRVMDELFMLHDDGVFLRREALEFGYDDRSLREAVRAGVLAKVRHGAYVSAAVWSEADATKRHWLRCCAVLRSHPPGAVALSHTSACVDHSVDLYRPALTKVHVLRLDGGVGRNLGDVTYHAGGWSASDVEEVEGRLRTALPRAAVEAALLGTTEQGKVVLDSALRRDDACLDRLGELARMMLTWPGGQRLQVAARLARPGAGSVGESLTDFLFWTERIPRPELQFEVCDAFGQVVAVLDFAWPEYGVFGEFDGKVKYGRLLKPGDDVTQVVVREKEREDLVRELTNFLGIRFIWSDLRERRRTGHRVRAKLAQGRTARRAA